MRHAFTLIELLVVIAIILVLCGCLLPGGLDGLIAFLFGWALYPLRVLRERDIDWPGTLLCAACLAALTLGVQFFGGWLAAHRSAAWPWSRTLKVMAIVMLMFFAGIVGIGITHEAVWLATSKEPLGTGSRPAAHRVASMNNLKQLGIAAHSHHDQKQTLPAGGTFDEHGRALHGWQTFLLPYLEQDALFQTIDVNAPWNHPANAAAMRTEVSLFINPAVLRTEEKGFAPSHYAGNILVLGSVPLKLNDITDGASHTILMGEVAGNFKPWGMPMNCRDPGLGTNHPNGFGTPVPHAKHVQFVFADGTVRTLRTDISPTVLKGLATPRGGEKIDADNLDP